jgi:SAM-dependent methyltransferase
MRHVSCDVCGADDSELFAERPARWDVLHRRFVRCRRCGLIFADPRAEPDEARDHYERVESRGSGSLGEATDSSSWRRAVAARRRHLERVASLLQRASGSTRFLEIGFGDASALAAAKELGWEPHGLEYANWLIDAARERLGLEHILLGDLDDLPADEDGTFDVVYAWHVIEHVLDVRAWLDRIAALLRPGGVVLLGTESSHSLHGRLWTLPARVARRVPWPPTSTDHTYWFGAEHLDSLLRRSGLAPVELRAYENSPKDVLSIDTIRAMRNPRWAAAFALYFGTSVAAVVAPQVGGKLDALAVREAESP